jgi:hypothetical protein
MLKSYSFCGASYWTSSSLCGFSSNAPKVEVTWS